MIMIMPKVAPAWKSIYKSSSILTFCQDRELEDRIFHPRSMGGTQENSEYHYHIINTVYKVGI